MNLKTACRLEKLHFREKKNRWRQSQTVKPCQEQAVVNEALTLHEQCFMHKNITIISEIMCLTRFINFKS